MTTTPLSLAASLGPQTTLAADAAAPTPAPRPQPSEVLGLPARRPNSPSGRLFSQGLLEGLAEHAKVATVVLGVACAVDQQVGGPGGSALSALVIALGASIPLLWFARYKNGALHEAAVVEQSLYEAETGPRGQKVSRMLAGALDALPADRRDKVKACLVEHWDELREAAFQACSHDAVQAERGRRTLASHTPLNEALGFEEADPRETLGRAMELLERIGSDQDGVTDEMVVLDSREFKQAFMVFNNANRLAPGRAERFWMDQTGRLPANLPDHPDDAVFMASTVLNRIGIAHERYAEALDRAAKVIERTDPFAAL